MKKLILLPLLSLAGCALLRPDPYSGYYVGRETVVRIAPWDTGLFLVVVGEKNKETSLIGEGSGDVLKAGSGEAVKIVREGDGFRLRAAGVEDHIERTDSLRYEKSRLALLGEP